MSGFNFYHTVVYLFHTSGFFKRMSGHFFYTADQLGRTSKPSRESSLKLKPRGCHMATPQNSSQTRKVVRVLFPVRGPISDDGRLDTGSSAKKCGNFFIRYKGHNRHKTTFLQLVFEPWKIL